MPPRKRFIDPTIWCDEDFCSLSLEARLLYLGLLSHSDDEGRLNGSPIEIRNKVFPGGDVTTESVVAWCNQIASRRLVVIYKNAGKSFIALRGFSQNLRWKTKSALPAPDDTDTPEANDIDSDKVKTSAVYDVMCSDVSCCVGVGDVYPSGITSSTKTCATPAHAPASRRSKPDPNVAAFKAAFEEAYKATFGRDLVISNHGQVGKQVKAVLAKVDLAELIGLIEPYFALAAKEREGRFFEGAPIEKFLMGPILNRLRSERVRADAPRPLSSANHDAAIQAALKEIPEGSSVRFDGREWTLSVDEASAKGEILFRREPTPDDPRFVCWPNDSLAYKTHGSSAAEIATQVRKLVEVLEPASASA